MCSGEFKRGAGCLSQTRPRLFTSGVLLEVLGKRRRALFGCFGVIVAVLTWELVVRFGILDATYLPPPSLVASDLPRLFIDGPLLMDLRASLSAVGTGTFISCLFGVALAVMAHLVQPLRWFIAPLVELVRGIAPLALLPAFLLFFGLGTSSTIAIIVWVAWPPVFINVLEGLDSTDRDLITAARSMGATAGWLLVTVYAPSLSNYFLTGLRLALGSAWLAVVAGEMLGANAGMGFRILEWSQTFRISNMYAAIVAIGVVSLALNAIVVVAQRHVTQWQRA